MTGCTMEIEKECKKNWGIQSDSLAITLLSSRSDPYSASPHNGYPSSLACNLIWWRLATAAETSHRVTFA